jgi:hypothetical protein
VSSVLPNFYAEWRVRCGVTPLFREDLETPPERLLQAAWQHQRLRRNQLHTLDGKTIRILHPGFRSFEGGPDFQGAVLQFGDEAPQTGDVEIDLRSGGWKAHGHDRNPAFKKVILHVIWDGDRPSSGSHATMAMKGTLDAPLGELNLWLGGDSAQGFPEALRGKCCAPLSNLSVTQFESLVKQAALVRLQSKAAQLQARARDAGWDQALWEGLFRALGYKHNIWPMQRIAELRPRWFQENAAPLAVEARLFGISGQLPVELSRDKSLRNDYVRQIWDHWWRERDAFLDCLLPRELWHMHGLRPANHPQRRLALAGGWLTGAELTKKIERWFTSEVQDAALPETLLETFQVQPHDFWSWHYTFRSARLPKPQTLLGAARVTDIAINVVLPWLWVRAEKNAVVRNKIEHRYFVWPPAEDNSLLRMARNRLMGGARRGVLRTAALQQGLVQIVRDFCERSNALCDNCQFPRLVSEFI